MKKRLILVMISGFITAASMTGCSDKSKDFGGTHYMEPTLENTYIIVDQNDKDILHKGDFYKSYSGTMNGFVFYCGEEFFSNADCSTHSEKPKDSLYDEICEECFHD